MTKDYTPLRFLYVFPHPDDESFGPALAISRQCREGHEVHLLTLTRGGATKIRHELGLSVQEMGAVRAREMERVRNALNLTSFVLHDFPDGELDRLDPLDLEEVVEEAIRRVDPHVLVTYAGRGVSGHPDHLVTHAVVKRVFSARRKSDESGSLRRLALFTVLPDADSEDRLNPSEPEEVGALVPVEDADVEGARRALACYETYRSVIEEHDPLSRIGKSVAFELFGERNETVLSSLTEGILP